MYKYLSILLFFWLCFLSCENNKKNDISTKPDDSVEDDSGVNALIEIPAGTLEKWEYNKRTGEIELELINDKPRIINYLGYPANYGMIPKTLLSKENGGDGDPIDVIVLGPPESKGSIIKCKIIGVLYLIDNSEQDYKLIAISENSNFKDINDIEELRTSYDGILKIIEIWFTNYKSGGRMKSNGYGDSKRALNILKNARSQFFNSL